MEAIIKDGRHKHPFVPLQMALALAAPVGIKGNYNDR